MLKVSIVTTHVDAPDWAELLIKSIRKFTPKSTYEIIVVDNGSLPQNIAWLRRQADIRLVEAGFNIGHGAGIDGGIANARYSYICVFDIDAHVQREGWLDEIMALYRSSNKVRLVGCRGPEHKPLKPPLFFFDKRFILSHQISFKHIPGVSTDTAQKAYHDIIGKGYEVVRLEPGRRIYDCYGDQFNIDEKPTFYHHWYGTRFCEHNPKRTKDELDGYTLRSYLANKGKLFQQPLVREILRG